MVRSPPARVLLGLALLCWAGLAVALAQGRGADAGVAPPRGLEALLGADAPPPTDAALEPALLDGLVQAAADSRAPEARRVRAAALLGRVDHPDAGTRLRALVTDGRAPPAVRAAALGALATREGRAAVDAAAPLLSAPETALREAAAAVVGRLGGLDAREALEARLPDEEDARVREAIQRALARAHP